MTRFLTSACLALFTLSHAFAQADADALTANQWVQPTEAGTLSGRILVPSGDGMARAVEGASVTISSVDGGGVSGQAVTDGMGEFTITGVTPGVYRITSRAADACSHAAIQVIDSSVDLGGRYPNVAEISAANMSYEAVSSALMRYRPPGNNRIITMADADLDALASLVINEEPYRVAQFDGGLNGRLYAAGAEGPNLIAAGMTNVFIMKNGVEVGRAVTNELGDFRINNLPVGSYSILAVGRDGFVAMSFELVGQGGGDVAVRAVDGKQLVSAVKFAGSYGCQLGPFAEGEGGGSGDGGTDDGVVIGPPMDFLDGYGGYGANTAAGSPGGNYYGGTGSSGSGFGGGLGDIAGLAGIGGIIAAISTNNDNGSSIIPPPTASDFLPSSISSSSLPDFLQ